MKLVIATPLYPPEIGGPAAYARAVYEGLKADGDTVTLVPFSNVRRYPRGIRHALYFLRVFSALRGADAVVAFDTWSTGIPALLASRIRGKRLIVRIGGDFLWEFSLRRTHALVKLSEFYSSERDFSLKERFILAGTRWFTRHADALIFNTAWQKNLWQRVYSFDPQKASVVENAYPAAREVSSAKGRVFVAAGRSHPLKNIQLLETVFADVKKRFPDIELDTRPLPPEEHTARIRDAYAVVIPSVSEVGPNTAIDAIRYGKPFIAPLDNGARERLADVGIFIDTLDAVALTGAVETLLDTGEYARACARVEVFAFSHSWDDVVKEYVAIVKKVCAS